MSQILSPSAIFGIIILVLIYMSGYKGVIGVAVIALILLAVVYTQQNRILYIPGRNSIMKLYRGWRNRLHLILSG